MRAPPQPSEIRLHLELEPALHAALGSRAVAAARRHLRERVTELLETLGLFHHVQFEITASAARGRRSVSSLKLRAEGQEVPYPAEILAWARCCVTGVPRQPISEPGAVWTWLREAGPETAQAFLARTCLEILRQRPSCLLNREAADAYIATLPPAENGEGADWLPDAAALLSLLRPALDHGISLADRQTVAETLRQVRASPPEEAAEALIAALAPNRLEIRVHPSYLREITAAEPGDWAARFALMRDALYVEYGLAFPNWQFVPEERLPPDSFAFTVNHLTVLPFVGLSRGQRLTDPSPEMLALLDVPAHAAINPGTDQAGSIASSEQEPLLTQYGFTTWDERAYVALCLGGTLRRNAARFVNRSMTDQHLDQLAQAFPALVQAIRARYSSEQITRLLRDLVADRLSIRNFRLILERLLDYEYDRFDPEAQRLPSSPESGGSPDLISYVRAGMQRTISYKHARNGSALPAYLLEPEFEKYLEDAPALRGDDSASDASASQELLEAVRRKVAPAREAHAPLPPLITQASLRPRLKAWLAPEFPDLPVLSYQEILPELDIQPVDLLTGNQDERQSRLQE